MERRITRLEQQNRRLRGGALIVLLVATSVLLLGQAAPPGEMKVKSLTVVDDEGTARIALGVTSERTHVSLLDETGQARVALRLAEDSPAIDILDAEGNVRAVLGARQWQIKKSGGAGRVVIKNEMFFGLLLPNGKLEWEAP